MAEKTSGSSQKTTVRRITAKDDAPVKKTATKTTVIKATDNAKSAKKHAPAKTVEKKTTATAASDAPSKNPLVNLGRYFKGAWHELKQVRWPTRSATWSLTLAVLLFSAAFVVFVMLLDGGFNWLFEQILN